MIGCMAVTLAAGSSTFADDSYSPPWQRGSNGTTFQEWDFSQSDTEPSPISDTLYNPYGSPLLRVNTSHGWLDVVDDTHVGVWPLSGEIDVYIPNRPLRLERKEIWLQLTWKPADLCPDPFLPAEPIVGITPFETMTMSRAENLDLGDDWVYTAFMINLYPNPDAEWITIKGDILVDQLVIDTYCIPEPTTFVLLGAGGWIIFVQRKRAL